MRQTSRVLLLMRKGLVNALSLLLKPVFRYLPVDVGMVGIASIVVIIVSVVRVPRVADLC